MKKIEIYVDGRIVEKRKKTQRDSFALHYTNTNLPMYRETDCLSLSIEKIDAKK